MITPLRIARAVVRRLRGVCGVARFTVWLRPLDTPPPRPEGLPGIQYRLAGESDLPLLEGWISVRETEEYRRRLRGGHLCLVGLAEGRAVFRVWAALRTHYPDTLNRVVDPGDDYAYLFDAATAPDYRRRGVARRGYALMCDHVRDLRCTQAVGWIDERNVPGRRALAPLGFTPRWRVLRVSLFRHHWFFGKPLV